MATVKPIKPDYWLKAKKHLSLADPVLARLIKTYKGETLASRGSAFFSLARAIVGQQISVKAAESVWKKLETTLSPSLSLKGEGEGTVLTIPSPFRGRVREGVSPQAVLHTPIETLRACGLSGQKVIYLKELSQFFAANKRHNWHKKDDAQVITDLIAIKGIGKWSAEMFLIFHLMRPDIFPLADLGLRKAIELHYNKGRKMPLPDMTALAETWRPYRTVATWYLWRSLDPIAVEY